MNNRIEVETLEINPTIVYCSKKLGKLNANMDINNVKSYLFRQIIDYQEEEFLEHIKKHLADYNQDESDPNNNIFLPDFPLEKILKEIKKYIPSDKRLYDGFYQNIYIFRYDSCGKDNRKTVNYFKVVCFHNTQNFITMVPVSNIRGMQYVDLNYLNLETTNNKTRKLSRIERFNQRYNLN